MKVQARLSQPTQSFGFTALELVISMTIVALLVATVVPGLRHVVLQNRMRAALTALHSDLALARGEAIGRSARIVVCPRASGDSCADRGEWQRGWLIFEDLNTDRERQEDEPLLRRTAAVESVRITGSDRRTRLRFFPNGSAPGSNATLTFCDERGAASARQLTVSASGRIRRKPAQETSVADCDRAGPA